MVYAKKEHVNLNWKKKLGVQYTKRKEYKLKYRDTYKLLSAGKER